MRCDIDDEPVALEMTPIIDCVFLLLIFFLVATTMKKIDHELPITLPEESYKVEAVQQPDVYHVVSVDAEGGYYFDGRSVGQGMLQDELRAVAEADPETKIRLDVDRDARFNDVMLVLDLLRFERFANVGVNTKKKE